MLIVSFSEQNRIIDYYHNKNYHCSYKHLIFLIQNDGYCWNNIWQSCKEFCLNCKACVISRSAVYKKPEIKQIVPVSKKIFGHFLKVLQNFMIPL